MSQRLYRDPQHGAVAGVCSGLADYFEVEVWVVRLVLVTGLIFASFLTFLLYVAAWILLPKRDDFVAAAVMPMVKQHGWQKGVNPAEALALTAQRLAELERRVQQIERCVTSRTYRVRRDLKGL